MSRSIACGELGPVGRARASVSDARRLLLRPTVDSLEESAAHLETAVGALREYRPEPGAETELEELRKEVSLAAALIEGAAAFYSGWARVLFTAACGYTASGEPAVPGPVRRISVEG
ncbi:MAG TPA: hypothetical protein PLA43_14745 [Bryobacteraceae bacterium]|nr:hypothetical protein [Bryobacteraceae bacterium]HOQ47494.1 hypothetical protein [Bryobacteraceae bacterium]HPQ17319.1 hypothetical protein [Bryobacteraceae bacterium]HPU73209.1 hypothetical protein [Bryobacteraceae bacterium]